MSYAARLPSWRSVTSLGLAAAVVVGVTTLEDSVVEAMRESGTRSDTLGTELTGWFWVAAAGALVSVVAAILAAAWCPAWPEMGSRYDAPGAAGPAAGEVPPEDRTHLDLWKQLDQGRDPTA